MLSLIYVLLAGIAGAAVNFCLRKNFERQTSAQGYLALYFIGSFLISFLFRFEFNLNSFSFVMGSIGVVAGMLNLLMMLLVARALQIGPAGLTFAFQNSASLFPALFLFVLFGSSFGFTFHIPLMIGFFCLILGLFLSVRTPNEHPEKTTHFGKWLFLAVSIFLVQGVILSIFQWRCLLIEYPAASHFLIPWTCTAQEDLWFMPGFFIIPALAQSANFFLSERRWLTSRELFLGTTAGLMNGAGTFCLLMAAKESGLSFRPILFPLFSVTVILLCNLWGKRVYGERIDWKGLTLCLSGVFMGSL